MSSFLSLKSSRIWLRRTVLARKRRQYSWQQLKLGSLLSCFISIIIVRQVAENIIQTGLFGWKQKIYKLLMEHKNQELCVQSREALPDTLPDAYDSVTESELINTLNFSIEDLLSKISKVQEDYEEGNQLLSTADDSALSNHTDNLQLRETNQDKSKKHRQENNETSTQGSSESSTKKNVEIEDNKQNSASLVRKSHDQGLANSPRKKYLNSHANTESCSLKHIQNDTFGEEKSFVPRRLKSLFMDIKQVAESHIFLEEEEGNCQSLGSNVQTMNQSFVETENNELRLGDFEIGHSVGSGKFGQVYICRHRMTGAIFALKKVFKSTIREYKMQSQFLLELKILYVMDHPNIIKLYGHFCDEYHIFLLMEYVEGGQLMARLKSNEEYITRVLDQTIDAVQYMHDRGIVHRDIKPENIVMAFENTPKLCDFGWAGEFDSKALKTTFCGTLDYVSPQMKDRGKYTSKVDLWSLGILTYELLTGEAPLKDEITNWRRKGAQMSTKWDWHISYPPSISGLGQSFMRNLLKQNPDERASLRFCKNHFFIRKYRETEGDRKIQLDL